MCITSEIRDCTDVYTLLLLMLMLIIKDDDYVLCLYSKMQTVPEDRIKAVRK